MKGRFADILLETGDNVLSSSLAYLATTNNVQVSFCNVDAIPKRALNDDHLYIFTLS